MKSSDATFGIGEIAARFGLATHVLRHWESVGLLSPVRVTGARRRYGHDELYRVAVILRAKEAGLGLDDIRELLTVAKPLARKEILERQRAALTERIARAQASLDLLGHALDCPHPDLTTCPHFRQSVAELVTP
ncbi:MerR family transcriptional regulator [Amycolatopsis sp. H20-H5]|nr:MerR family transcriptional regulator [Amycolatopsis sp. H20-H5]MEC3977142.1 MerR family transcriptional regulator [Amycolatopsis sp. H20-H5]